MKYRITTGAKVSKEYAEGYERIFGKRRKVKAHGSRIEQVKPKVIHRVYPVCGEDGGFKLLKD